MIDRVTHITMETKLQRDRDSIEFIWHAILTGITLGIWEGKEFGCITKLHNNRGYHYKCRIRNSTIGYRNRWRKIRETSTIIHRVKPSKEKLPGKEEVSISNFNNDKDIIILAAGERMIKADTHLLARTRKSEIAETQKTDKLNDDYGKRNDPAKKFSDLALCRQTPGDTDSPCKRWWFWVITQLLNKASEEDHTFKLSEEKTLKAVHRGIFKSYPPTSQAKSDQRGIWSDQDWLAGNPGTTSQNRQEQEHH